MTQRTKISLPFVLTLFLLSSLLVLAACGSDGDAEAPSEDGSAVIEEATALPDEEDADSEAEAEAEPDTDSEEMAETEMMTDTTAITETETVSDMDVMTDTESMTETEMMTDTESMMDTESMTETHDVDSSEVMTDSQSMDMDETDAEVADADSDDMADDAEMMTGMVGADGMLMRASTLTGYDFTNQDGEISGNVDDFLVDVSTGQILFAFVEYGGLLEIGDTNLVMPLSAFQQGDDQLILNFDEQELENFPSVGDNWPDITDTAWDDDVATFWRDINLDPGIDFDETNSSAVMWLTNMTGYSLVDMVGGSGIIQDVIIDLAHSRIQYIVFNDALLTVDDDAYLVPYSALDVQNLGTNEIAFHSNIDMTTFEDAPRYDYDRFADGLMSAEEIDQEVDEFWRELGFEDN